MTQNRELAGVFAHAGVAASYRHRPPYPDQVFDLLVGLMPSGPGAVLDLGAGEGALARPLSERVERVDAVELSEAMIATGQNRPGGRRSNLRWILGAAEAAAMDGPYALITAGASLHWMDWPRLMPRLRAALSPGGVLAIVEHGPRDVPWQAAVVEVIRRHSRSRDYDPAFSIVDALRERGFLEPLGQIETEPERFRQLTADYVEQFHSTSSLAREHMSPAEASEFDEAITRAVAPWVVDGALEMDVVATISWGTPSEPHS
ncbi:MAG TPA: class I SAM-dependent methyltransferase [Micromonosporaceae bacterium]|jgi:SAM-dependent methyltransferase